MYADDTSIIFSSNSLQETTNQANALLKSIAEWFCANKLQLNHKKTDCVIFHPRQKVLAEDTEIRIGYDLINQMKLIANIILLVLLISYPVCGQEDEETSSDAEIGDPDQEEAKPPEAIDEVATIAEPDDNNIEEHEPDVNTDEPDEPDEPNEPEESTAPIKVHDFTKDPDYILMKTMNFIKEEIATHLMTDREFNEAIRAINSKEITEMLDTLMAHPKYVTLNLLLQENKLGSMEYFAISGFTVNLPKRSRIKPSFEKLMQHIFRYIRDPSVLDGIRAIITKTDYHRVLHKAMLKKKLNMLVNDLLKLRIAEKLINKLDMYHMHTRTIINCILYVIGYVDSVKLPNF